MLIAYSQLSSRSPEVQRNVLFIDRWHDAVSLHLSLSTWPLKLLRLRHILKTPISRVSSTRLLSNHQASVGAPRQFACQFIVSTTDDYLANTPVAPHPPLGYRTSGGGPSRFSSTFLIPLDSTLKGGLMVVRSLGVGISQTMDRAKK